MKTEFFRNCVYKQVIFFVVTIQLLYQSLSLKILKWQLLWTQNKQAVLKDTYAKDRQKKLDANICTSDFIQPGGRFFQKLNRFWSEMSISILKKTNKQSKTYSMSSIQIFFKLLFHQVKKLKALIVLLFKNFANQVFYFFNSNLPILTWCLKMDLQ